MPRFIGIGLTVRHVSVLTDTQTDILQACVQNQKAG